MHQSIPAVNIPPPPSERLLEIRTSFLTAPRVFPKKVLPGAGFRSGQTLPEADKNLQRISIFSKRFQEATKNGRKMLVFFHNNYIFFLQHLFLKNVRGLQSLSIEAAETSCMVCLPPEKHFFRKKYLGNRPFKKSNFIRV